MRTIAIVAQEAPAAPAEGQKEQPGGMMQMLIPFVLIIGIFYLLVLRPQKKKQKQEQQKHDEMLKNLKKNDRVLTIGRIYGIVASVTEKHVVLKVDEKKDVSIRVARDAILRVITEEDEKEAEAKAAELPAS